MERLIWECELDGFTDIGLRDGVTVGAAICRLSAYERTGLEPEEISALCDMDRRAKIAEMLRLEESFGVSIDRLQELAQADREGRCVVLPAKESLKKGMSVWYVDTDTGEIEEGKVFSINYKGEHLDSFSVNFKVSDDFDEFLGSAWGDCLFGSKKQAEAALRREQE